MEYLGSGECRRNDWALPPITKSTPNRIPNKSEPSCHAHRKRARDRHSAKVIAADPVVLASRVRLRVEALVVIEGEQISTQKADAQVFKAATEATKTVSKAYFA